MQSSKTRVIVVLVLLTLGSLWLLPRGLEAKNDKGGNELAQRVEVLEQQVADLTSRIEVLEVNCNCSPPDPNGPGDDLPWELP